MVGVSLARVSSWGHEMKPSACSSKGVAMSAVLARVASWGKAKALSPDEARLNVGVVGGWGVEKGAGEGRQFTTVE